MIADIPFGSLPFRPLELLANRGIRASTSAQALAGALDGRSMDVRVEGSPLALRVSVAGGGVKIGPAGDEKAPDVLLEGGALSMLRLLRGDPQQPVREGGVRLTGDTELAGQFRELFRLARPDVEEELSALLGDPLAHQLGELARGFGDWSRRAGDSVGRSVGDYLKEERRSLPARAEVDEFVAAVDTLANDVERAAARLERLLTRSDAK